MPRLPDNRGVTRSVLAAVFACFVVALPARAEVLVYGGNLQRFSSGDDPALQKRKAFLVVDQDHGKFSIVSYGRSKLGQHHDFPAVNDIDYLAFPRGDGGVEDGFATTINDGLFTGVGGGGYGATIVHGTRVPLVISVTGDVKNVQPRAKVLTGTNFGAATTLFGAFYNQDTFTVKFDQTRTIEENGAGSTVDAAIAHVVGFLESKGYVLGP